MAQESNNIARRVAFLTFLREQKPTGVKIAPFVNSHTAEKFLSVVILREDGTKTLISFGKSVGELSPQELKAQAHDLMVAKMLPDENGKDHYVLYKDTWQDVDIMDLL